MGEELEKESRTRLQLERQLSQARLDYEALQNFSKDYREIKQQLDEKNTELAKASTAIQNLEAVLGKEMKEKESLEKKHLKSQEEYKQQIEAAEDVRAVSSDAKRKALELEEEIKSLRSKHTLSQTYILKL